MYVLRSVIESRKPKLVSKFTIKLTHAKSILAIAFHPVSSASESTDFGLFIKPAPSAKKKKKERKI